MQISCWLILVPIILIVLYPCKNIHFFFLITAAAPASPHNFSPQQLCKVLLVLQGPVSESKFSENLELVNPEMRKTLFFRFHKASSSTLSKLLRETNLLAGRFASTDPEFALKLKPAD